MLNRCYNVNDTNYHNYGGNGVTVDKEWYDFSKFFYDFIELPGYDKQLLLSSKLELDKDKLQCDLDRSERIYSKHTCCLLSHKAQCSYRKLDYNNIGDKCAVEFIVIYPDGTTHVDKNLTKFAKTHKLSTGAISNCLSGKRNTHKGYKFKPYAYV